MPNSEADLEWLERALRTYFAAHEAELDDAGSRIGGADLVRDALDDWAYRSDDAHRIYERTIFVWERRLAGQSISPAALDAAWPGEHIPPPDEDELAAASALAKGICDRLAALDEADLQEAVTAAVGMKQMQAAIARWTAGHDRSETAVRVLLILDRVIAGQPIDPDSLDAAWHAVP